jgi:hypothetical protein
MTPITSKVTLLRKDWNNWKAMVSQSGWKEDDNGLPIADQQSLNTYFLEHKEMRKFRYKPLPYREQLEELFTDLSATGVSAASVEEVVAHQDEEEETQET